MWAHVPYLNWTTFGGQTHFHMLCSTLVQYEVIIEFGSSMATSALTTKGYKMIYTTSRSLNRGLLTSSQIQSAFTKTWLSQWKCIAKHSLSHKIYNPPQKNKQKTVVLHLCTIFWPGCSSTQHSCKSFRSFSSAPATSVFSDKHFLHTSKNVRKPGPQASLCSEL